MKKFIIKTEKSEKEKAFLNLKDQLFIRDEIELQCHTINGLNDYDGIKEIKKWYIDDNFLLIPEKFVKMHYNEVIES